MSTPIYSLRNLKKEYQGRRILDIDELDIMRNESFALVGPSGAGKSTLLRMLNFLESPSSGSIEFAGVKYEASTEMSLDMRRRVTTVFQHPMLLHRSVRDNVVYGLRLRGERDSNGLCNSVLERVGLSQLAHQKAHTLSGGEAQRVALARTMVLQPDVLLLDEPTANLDPYNIGMIESIIMRLNQEEGTTLVLVTHNIFQARRLANRVGLLLEGKLVEVSDVDKFFNSPRDSRTAAFVRGDMVY